MADIKFGGKQRSDNQANCICTIFTLNWEVDVAGKVINSVLNKFYLGLQNMWSHERQRQLVIQRQIHKQRAKGIQDGDRVLGFLPGVEIVAGFPVSEWSIESILLIPDT